MGCPFSKRAMLVEAFFCRTLQSKKTKELGPHKTREAITVCVFVFFPRVAVSSVPLQSPAPVVRRFCAGLGRRRSPHINNVGLYLLCTVQDNCTPLGRRSKRAGEGENGLRFLEIKYRWNLFRTDAPVPKCYARHL